MAFHNYSSGSVKRSKKTNCYGWTWGLQARTQILNTANVKPKLMALRDVEHNSKHNVRLRDRYSPACLEVASLTTKPCAHGSGTLWQKLFYLHFHWFHCHIWLSCKKNVGSTSNLQWNCTTLLTVTFIWSGTHQWICANVFWLISLLGLRILTALRSEKNLYRQLES